MREGCVRRRRAIAPIIFAGFLVGFLLPAPAADACSFATNEPHTIDAAEAEVDRSPPSAPTVSVTVSRGRSGSSAMCADSGSVDFALAAVDDRTSAENMGYAFDLVAGELPSGLALPSGAVRTLAWNSTVGLVWMDGATDDQEPFDVALAVTAVDLAGNEGPATSVRVTSLGGVSDDDGSGCTIGSRGPTGATIAALAAGLLALAARRNARRRPTGRLAPR